MSLKEFLKPTKGKILWFIVILAIVPVIRTQCAMCGIGDSCPCWSIPHFFGLLYAFSNYSLSWLFTEPHGTIGYFSIQFPIIVISSYVIVCAIINIYRKRKQAKNDQQTPGTRKL
jgi:hypothetical protein